MADPELGESEERRLRRSRTLAAAGFILLATSALLPWWTVRLTEDGQLTDRVDLQLWDRHTIARTALQWASGILVAAALLALFVRIAAGSWRHEPPSWRRDLALALAAVAVALVLAWLWPTGDPRFWDTTTAAVDGVRLVEKSRPGLGWWSGMGTAVLLGLSRLAASPTTEK
jgi:hypothetical protein